jgi:hypothetical protein
MAVETQRVVASSGERDDEVRLLGIDLTALEGQCRLLERGFEPLDDIDRSPGWVLRLVADECLCDLVQFLAIGKEILCDGRRQIGCVHDYVGGVASSVLAPTLRG